MRNDELVIKLRLPRWTTRRWLIIGVLMAVSVVALAAPMFTDGMTLKAADLNALADGAVPPGAVMYFNLQACPPGWTEQVTARGRYIVGLPAGGTLFGTTGTPLGDKEDRPVGQHTHAVTDPGHSHTVGAFEGNAMNHNASPYNNLGGFIWNSTGNTSAATTGIAINGAGPVPGTNAPYIQLLVCQKN